MDQNKKRSFNTRAVHAGERANKPDFTPVSTPIYTSVGYLYDSMDDLDAVFAKDREGYVYPRYGSPTVSAFEAAVADLEEGESAIGFASGMAAVHVALLAAGLRPGMHVVAALDVYGATYTMVSRLFSTLGVTAHMVDVTDLPAVEETLRMTKPVLLYVETISNPLMKVADLPALVELAHQHGAQLLVDSTFTTPYLIKPLKLGADMVIHSATKYMGGHGDVMAGVVVTSKEKRDLLFETNKLVGSVLGPFEAWLTLRGVKTLSLRMRQHCENAARVAAWLAEHPKIARVNYPGLAEHPQHALAERLLQGRGFGGMLSFEIGEADRSRVFRFMEALALCLPATTLGDVYTLLLHPASSSHRSLSEEEREQVGIREGLVRLSAGIEDAADIIYDLEQALAKV